MIWSLIKQNMLLAVRQKSDLGLVVAFFVMAGMFFPLSIGPEQAILVRVAGGVIWILALFTSTLSLQKVFTTDFEDGTVEMLYLSQVPLELYVLAKTTSHLILIGIPVLLMATVVGGVMQIPILTLFMALLVGLPSLIFIGVIGMTIGLGTSKNTMLMTLLVFPLYIPVLIFGSSAIEASITGLSPQPHILILLAIMLFSFVLHIYAGAANLLSSLKK